MLTIVAGAVSPATVARAATRNVDEVNTSFQPAEIDVVVNDRVVWTNRSTQSHTVTFDRGPDLTPNCDTLLRLSCQSPGTTVERTFTSPGTYSYHCRIHVAQGMTGVVVVTAATSTTAAKSSTTTTAKASSSTTTTARGTSSSTTTTRPLATSSTVVRSSTTTSDTSSAVLPGAPPSLSGDSSSAAGGGAGGSGGSDRGAVALIVGLLLAVSAGGGYLLWRLRPGRP